MHAEPWPSETTCPRWCNGAHDHADDRTPAHRSDPWCVPTVERRTLPGGAAFERVASTDLTIGIEQRWGDTWVWISPEDSVRRSLVLTRESAQRLHRALTTIFEDLLP